jgi:dihydrolipoamide dehydrogenase
MVAESKNGRYQVAFLGSGPGGYVSAIRAAQLGLRTAIIEKDPALGGTCLHRGCIPTKVLLETATLFRNMKRSQEFGIRAEGVTLDIELLHARNKKVVRKLTLGVETLMKANRIEVIKGTGALEGPHTIRVAADGAAPRAVEADHIVLATGSTPRLLPGIEADGERVITSNEALWLPKIPKSMIVLGAGAVGIEFASIYNRFGTEVTVVEILPRVLPIEDHDVSTEIAKALAKDGVKIHTQTKVEGVKRTKTGVEVTAVGPDGKAMTVSAEILLVAVGRKPNTEAIGIEKTRVRLDRGFVTVDEYSQTNEPGLYAIGDILPRPQLAHVAWSEGIVAVEHMAKAPTRPVNWDRIPSCTYCAPEVASVGLTEAKAKERGLDVKVGKFPFAAIGRATIEGEAAGFVKIVSAKKYDEILGVHIIGPHATELIAEACVALSCEATTEELIRTIHAHPTLSECVNEAARAVNGAAFHYHS